MFWRRKLAWFHTADRVRAEGGVGFLLVGRDHENDALGTSRGQHSWKLARKIGQVEESLPPGDVRWRRVGLQARGEVTGVESIN